MLKYIKIMNFLSFKEETEINFESSNYWWKKNNVFSIWKNVLLKSMLIYWANASWKSNILKSVVTIHNFVLNKTNPTIVTPFLLDIDYKNKPSYFEICFFIDNKEYVYIFEIFWWIVIIEKLYEKKWDKKLNLFIREKQNIKFENELKYFSWQLEDKVKETTSLLWILDQFNWKLNWKPILYFFNKLNSLWSVYSPDETISLLKLYESEKNKQFVLEFLKCADINICEIQIKKETRNVLQFDFAKKSIVEWLEEWYRIDLWHKVRWSNEKEYFSLLWWEESTWTQKLFWILWRIVTTILNEWVLFFDEIESNLHPHIVKNIFNLLNSDLWKKYQFIFTSHNIELMNLRDFKKEQIWIIKKTKENNFSELYTLYDFEDLRSENDVQKYYNNWAFWWIPNTADFSTLFKSFKLWE